MEKFVQIPEEIQLLIADLIQGTIDEPGMRLLNRWASESDENLNQVNALKSAWIKSGKTLHKSEEQTNAALQKTKRSLKLQKVKKSYSFRDVVKIAATWFAFLLAGAALSTWITQKYFAKNLKLIVTSVTTPLGSKSILDLPDGTKVWLNAGSKITYNNNYGSSVREVELTGEAYFSVRSDKTKPFLVRTSDVIVKALGTKFNVKAYPEEKTITATLEEGKIEVTDIHRAASPDKKIVLKPNEMVTFYKASGETKSISKENTSEANTSGKEMTPSLKVSPDIRTELITSWKDKTWIIEGQSFGTLAPVLERRYNMVISFASENIKKYKFTGKIQNETIEQILSAMELSAPILYQIRKDTISLTINKGLLHLYNQYTN